MVKLQLLCLTISVYDNKAIELSSVVYTFHKGMIS